MSGPILSDMDIDAVAKSVQPRINRVPREDIERAICIAQAERIAEWLDSMDEDVYCAGIAGNLADQLRAAIKQEKEA